MMILRNVSIAATLIPCLLLVACSSKEEPVELQVSGAKTSVSIMHIIAKRSLQNNRPSGLLGVFTGLYTSQGVFLSVQSAEDGMLAIGNILKGQTNSTSDENFALLREVGDILQVDIIDTLNRSTDRVSTLDSYTQSLRNIGVLTERKITELSALHETQKTKAKESQKKVRTIEGDLRDALKITDYGTASELEEQLSEANVSYAEISTKEDQSGDMIDRFDTLLKVAAQRVQAVEVNREILVAGLRVIDVPGIADFNILEKGKSWKKRKGKSIFE
jgi:hypothetical protein